MEKNDTHYIRFDWAAKHILRDKADFSVFEGFLTVLLKERVKIVELLESESNQQNEDDKFNRVDIKAKNSNGEIILVEIQQSEEYYYLQRMVYGVAKTITEHITKGKQYSDVKKVYSVNIVYFDLGEGSDYLYHGQNRLIGMNTGDELQMDNVFFWREKQTTPDPDGIETVRQRDVDGVAAPYADAVYNLQGQRVARLSDVKEQRVRLPRGLYIINGKKLVVR